MKQTLLLYTLLFLFTLTVQAQRAMEDQDGWIIHLNTDTKPFELIQYAVRQDIDLRLVAKLSQRDELYHVIFRNSSKEAINRILNSAHIDSYMPNSIASIRKTPNDTLYNKQWNIVKTQIDRVWDSTTGGKTVDGDEIVVAVMDDGFVLDNSVFGDNIYDNPFDQPGDMNDDGCPGICGVDDDGDGLIDEDHFGTEKGQPGYQDIYKYDDDENGYYDDTNGVHIGTKNDNHPKRGHGTSAAAIIGAAGNNINGIAGINWDVKILPISDGTKLAQIIAGYNYIYEMRDLYNKTNGEKGAFIVASNYSLGINRGNIDQHKIWCDIYDKLGEVGVLNVSAVTNENEFIDTYGDVPSQCPSKYLLSITSTDSEDKFADFGFSKTTVDLAAPGPGVWSTSLNQAGGYGVFGGNSTASPHVAGVIGLLYSIPCPEFIEYFKKNPSEVYKIGDVLMQTGDKLASLKGLTKTETRLNALAAMASLSGYCIEYENKVGINKIYPNPGSEQIEISFDADPTKKIYANIYNILGQLIERKELLHPVFQKPKATINIGHLVNGVYILMIQQDKNLATKQFIKM